MLAFTSTTVRAAAQCFALRQASAACFVPTVRCPAPTLGERAVRDIAKRNPPDKPNPSAAGGPHRRMWSTSKRGDRAIQSSSSTCVKLSLVRDELRRRVPETAKLRGLAEQIRRWRALSATCFPLCAG